MKKKLTLCGTKLTEGYKCEHARVAPLVTNANSVFMLKNAKDLWKARAVMTYRCIKDFEIPWLGEDGEDTENFGFVTCDSLWEIQSCYPISGAEVRLNSLDYDEGNQSFNGLKFQKKD